MAKGGECSIARGDDNCGLEFVPRIRMMHGGYVGFEMMCGGVGPGVIKQHARHSARLTVPFRVHLFVASLVQCTDARYEKADQEKKRNN